MTTLDSKQYKEAERQKWDNVANGWQKWLKTIERGAGKLCMRLIELAEIKPGSRVLDIATGIGEPAITAASFYICSLKKLCVCVPAIISGRHHLVFHKMTDSSVFQQLLLVATMYSWRVMSLRIINEDVLKDF